jgi:hypothetical protein
MDQVLIPVGHHALLLPSMKRSQGNYCLEPLSGIFPPGKIYLVEGFFLLLHKITHLNLNFLLQNNVPIHHSLYSQNV